MRQVGCCSYMLYLGSQAIPENNCRGMNHVVEQSSYQNNLEWENNHHADNQPVYGREYHKCDIQGQQENNHWNKDHNAQAHHLKLYLAAAQIHAKFGRVYFAYTNVTNVTYTRS